MFRFTENLTQFSGFVYVIIVLQRNLNPEAVVTNQPRGFGKVSFHNARDLSYLSFFLLSIVNIAFYFSYCSIMSKRFRTDFAQCTIVVSLMIICYNTCAPCYFPLVSHVKHELLQCPCSAQMHVVFVVIQYDNFLSGFIFIKFYSIYKSRV